jgi:rhodanese-related sulfurtransferase
MDEEFSGVLEKHLTSLGLEIHLNSALKEITGAAHVESVVLEDGTEIPCDLVILAMGVRPTTELALKAGVEIGVTGGVLVDATMRTSDPDIYAAGDMTESLHLVSGKKVRIPLAGSANKQGRVAGACAAGSKMLFQGVIGTSILKVGDLTAARTGLNEREAKQAGLSYRTSYIPGESSATYYPGAESMIIKMTIETPTGKILGAQAVGRKGVDKRIDVLATAIYSGLTVFDLENLDLAYAPPYSSAKDPVIMGGMICANMLRNDLSYVNPAQLEEKLSQVNSVLLDVRTQEEFDEGYIEGAVFLPVDELRKRYKELDPAKTYIIYCGIGYRAYIACLFLNSHGYKTYNLSGGYRAYTMDIL